jgi:hypothetical protein
VGNEDQDAASKAPCGLLDIPLELRTDIWKLVAVSDRPLCAYVPRIQHVDEQNRAQLSYSDRYLDEVLTFTVRRYPLEPASANANRQIRLEILPIFYNHNCFIISAPADKGSDGHGPAIDQQMIQRWLSLSVVTANVRALDIVRRKSCWRAMARDLQTPSKSWRCGHCSHALSGTTRKISPREDIAEWLTGRASQP